MRHAVACTMFMAVHVYVSCRMHVTCPCLRLMCMCHVSDMHGVCVWAACCCCDVCRCVCVCLCVCVVSVLTAGLMVSGTSGSSMLGERGKGDHNYTRGSASHVHSTCMLHTSMTTQRASIRIPRSHINTTQHALHHCMFFFSLIGVCAGCTSVAGLVGTAVWLAWFQLD